MPRKKIAWTTILKETEKTYKGYVNLAAIRHSNKDFIMDFCFTEPLSEPEYRELTGKGKRILPITARLVSSPAFIPELMKALQIQWAEYQKEQKTD